MKVKLKQMIAGPHGVFKEGVHEFEEDFAKPLIDGGIAEVLEDSSGKKSEETKVEESEEKKIQTRVSKPKQKAVTRTKNDTES